MPALLTSQSRRPKRSNVRLIHVSTSVLRVTSSCVKKAVPPAASIAATVRRPSSSLRPATATAAPIEASFTAIARPMPLEAPVTAAARLTEATDRILGTSQRAEIVKTDSSQHRGVGGLAEQDAAGELAGGLVDLGVRGRRVRGAGA